MAGDWIPIRVDLMDDPAVIEISNACGLDEHGTVGRLVKLWSWANRHLITGHDKSVTESWIDRFLSTPGFAAAMLSAGWLASRSGQITFPKFERWNSQGAKRRLLAAKRQQSKRSQECHAASVTKTLPEKRRVKKKTNTEEPPNPQSQTATNSADDQPWDKAVCPLPHDGGEFTKAWGEWVLMRAAKKVPVTNRIARLTIEKFRKAGLTLAEATEAVFESAANGWQGIVLDRVLGKRTGGGQTNRFTTRRDQEINRLNENAAIVREAEASLKRNQHDGQQTVSHGPAGYQPLAIGTG